MSKSLELQEIKRCFALPEAVLVPELLPSVEFLECPYIGGTAVGSVHILWYGERGCALAQNRVEGRFH